jgi:hypothetical protein
MDIANAALFFGRIGERVAIGLNNDLWVVVHLMIAGRWVRR